MVFLRLVLLNAVALASMTKAVLICKAGQRCYHRVYTFSIVYFVRIFDFCLDTPSMKVGNYLELAFSSSSSLCIQWLLLLLLLFSIYFCTYAHPTALIHLIRAIIGAKSFCLLLHALLVFACFQGGNNISMFPSVKWKNLRFL